MSIVFMKKPQMVFLIHFENEPLSHLSKLGDSPKEIEVEAGQIRPGWEFWKFIMLIVCSVDHIEVVKLFGFIKDREFILVILDPKFRI